VVFLLQNLLWGLLVFQSFAALGRFMAHALKSDRKREVALPAGWGMAGMTVLGGWLNLLGLAKPVVLIPLVLCVVVVDLWRDWRSALGLGHTESSLSPDSLRKRSRELVWVLPLAFIVGIKYVASLGTAFNTPDDQPAYLLQLSRMLQTGSIGVDPFSVRQFMSLNGQTFLLGLLCSVAPPSYIFLLDPGICWLMLAGLTFSIVRLDLKGCLRDSCLATALVLLVKVPFINATGYLCATVLFLTLIRTAYREWGAGGERRNGALFLLAMTTAGLFALKTTYIYFAGLFLAVWFGLRLLHGGRLAVVREIALVGLIVPVLLLPWMQQQYRSAGTPLYPLLGKGTQATGPGMGPFSDSLVTKAKATIYFLSQGPNVAPIVALIVLAFNPFKDDPARWRVLLASLLSASTGSLILSFQLASNAIERYTQSILFAALIPAGLAGFFSPRPSRLSMVLALCLALFVGSRWDNLHSSLATFLDFFRAGRPGFLYKEENSARVQKAQASIPLGKTTLVWIQDAFLLDFSRNPILNLDQMGMAGPPPGLPITSDPAGLADYLMQKTYQLPRPASADKLLQYFRNNGVEFLMFQRGEKTAWYHCSESEIHKKPYWNRLISTLSLLGYKELVSLRERTRTVYDDGDFVVLDLEPAGQQPETLPLDRRGAGLHYQLRHQVPYGPG
jgi:hypothetical protein